MRRTMLASLALVIALAFSSSAHAQFPINKNVILNSGNGINNTIAINNGGFSPGGFVPVPGGFVPGGFVPGGFVPSFGGTNINRISNSGNGVGNIINVQNGGGFVPSFGGTNINILNNVGNGAGNIINIRNR